GAAGAGSPSATDVGSAAGDWKSVGDEKRRSRDCAGEKSTTRRSSALFSNGCCDCPSNVSGSPDAPKLHPYLRCISRELNSDVVVSGSLSLAAAAMIAPTPTSVTPITAKAT